MPDAQELIERLLAYKSHIHGETVLVCAEAADTIASLQRREEMLREENARLRERGRIGEGAIQIVAELSALVPLKDSIRANETGRTLVEYFRQALEDTDNA